MKIKAILSILSLAFVGVSLMTSCSSKAVPAEASTAGAAAAPPGFVCGPNG